MKFVIGEGRVIKAFHMGLLDMCVGEKRTIIAPSKLAYEWGKGEHTSIKSVFF